MKILLVWSVQNFKNFEILSDCWPVCKNQGAAVTQIFYTTKVIASNLQNCWIHPLHVPWFICSSFSVPFWRVDHLVPSSADCTHDVISEAPAIISIKRCNVLGSCYFHVVLCLWHHRYDDVNVDIRLVIKQAPDSTNLVCIGWRWEPLKSL